MGNMPSDFAENRLMSMHEAVSFRLATDADRQYVFEGTLDDLREAQTASERIPNWTDFVVSWHDTSNYIIYIGDQKAGLIRWERRPDVLHLTGLYLAPAFRRRGAGTAAMEFFENYAASHSFKQVSLIACPSDGTAAEFASALGYVVERQYRHCAVMVKRLRGEN